MRVLMILVVALAGCAPAAPSATSALPLDARDGTVQLATLKDDLDGADREGADREGADREGAGAGAAGSAGFAPSGSAVPAVRGLGFAQISGQPGKTQNEKRLMAIRAARVDALRDLAEQVHGVRVSANTTVRDAVVADDRLEAVVTGTLRGARTLRVTASGSDSYEVEMELDSDTVAYVVRALKGRA